MSAFIQTWRGDVVISECDELGHLNMRYYLAKAQQARQFFFIRLGLPQAFEAGAHSTVGFRECHIRFHREARPHDNLRIETGIVSVGEDDMQLVHVFFHRDGRVAAAITEIVDHIYLRTGRKFAWPNRVISASKEFTVKPPDAAKARGLYLTAPMIGPDLDQVQEWGCDPISQGVFKPREANVFGTISAQNYVGRLSDAITSFDAGWPEFKDEGWKTTKIIGVMLEFRLRVHRDAAPGMALEIHSGVMDYTDKIRQLVHNFINPASGHSYATLIAVNGLIDLNARKFANPSPKALAGLEAAKIKGLSA